MGLRERAQLERLFWHCCEKIQDTLVRVKFVPEELQGLEQAMAAIYYCNFSLFQSAPDVWAINQLFPIMPIHRLEEEPSHPAVLGDITCDSDGKVDAFIDRRDVKRTLLLHAFNGDDYYLGAFLLGAYQEILGDLHNLFGDTNTVHVRVGPTGEVLLDSVIKGDTVREVLNYVQFNADVLVSRLRRDVETALREGRLSYEESGALLRFYEEGLHGYTYLEDVHER
jgi:arginine decarboxylase